MLLTNRKRDTPPEFHEWYLAKSSVIKNRQDRKLANLANLSVLVAGIDMLLGLSKGGKQGGPEALWLTPGGGQQPVKSGIPDQWSRNNSIVRRKRARLSPPRSPPFTAA
ncbi:uncharacterized [Tachysurus ichikawai]